jgi:hypothetical protein
MPWLCDGRHGRVSPLRWLRHRSQRWLCSYRWRGTQTEPRPMMSTSKFLHCLPCIRGQGCGGETRCSLEPKPPAWTGCLPPYWQLPPCACRSLVYSAMYESCLCCFAVQGSDWRWRAVGGGDERAVVREHCEAAHLQHVSEEVDADEDGLHLPVKSAVVGLCSILFFREKT